MENNEIMNTEVVEKTAELVETGSQSTGFGTLAVVGAAAIGGGLLHKFVVGPLWKKFRASRKKNRYTEVDVDEAQVEVVDD